MKAKTSQTETVDAPLTDPKVVTDLEEMIKIISDCESKAPRLREEADKHWETVDFILATDGQKNYRGFPPETVYARYGPEITGRAKREMDEAMEKYRIVCNKLNASNELRKETEAKLRLFVRDEGSRYDSAILSRYEGLVEKNAQEILAVCDDLEEARIVARGLNKPARLHSRLNSWRRGEMAFLIELKQSVK